MRIAVALASISLLIIFLSTGTNPPGDRLFLPLYRLPLGWLLREPGRFLMLVSLAFAAMVGVTTEAVSHSRLVLRMRGWRFRSSEIVRGVLPATTLASTFLLGFPLFTGAIVPDGRAGLPPAHVQMPAYWRQMAQFVDGLPSQGAVLILPPDDYYQMPYSWGYYGSDGFIVELFHRHVLVPSGQGYSPASSEVLSAVDMTANGILSGDWLRVETLLLDLNSPFVLVRMDVETGIPDRTILPPQDLFDALIASPKFTLLRRFGSLALFELLRPSSELTTAADFVTVNTQTPDLRLLSVF